MKFKCYLKKEFNRNSNLVIVTSGSGWKIKETKRNDLCKVMWDTNYVAEDLEPKYQTQIEKKLTKIIKM